MSWILRRETRLISPDMRTCPSADTRVVDSGKSPRGPGSLGRSVVTLFHSHRAAEPIFHRNDLFQQFALDYAASEDKIRKLYEELERETQQLHVLPFIFPAFPTDPCTFCWRAGTHGRKAGIYNQARQVAREELHQGTNPHKKVL